VYEDIKSEHSVVNRTVYSLPDVEEDDVSNAALPKAPSDFTVHRFIHKRVQLLIIALSIEYILKLNPSFSSRLQPIVEQLQQQEKLRQQQQEEKLRQQHLQEKQRQQQLQQQQQQQKQQREEERVDTKSVEQHQGSMHSNVSSNKRSHAGMQLEVLLIIELVIGDVKEQFLIKFQELKEYVHHIHSLYPSNS
jgi:hypothetical protein